MPKSKTIELFTYIYNDQDMLPLFLDYYSFVDRMTFIDSGSDDNTQKILEDFAQKWDGELRICQTGLTWWDHEALHYYRNNIWKGSKYTYVLFPDCDEIFYHAEGLRNFIFRTNNDVYAMQGYEMVGEFPKGKITDVKTGVPFYMYNKSTIFKPSIEIEFPNAHLRYTRTTNINMGEVKLLHYRNLGIEYMKFRRDREKKRLPKNCKYRCFHTDRELEARFKELTKNAVNVI